MINYLIVVADKAIAKELYPQNIRYKDVDDVQYSCSLHSIDTMPNFDLNFYGLNGCVYYVTVDIPYATCLINGTSIDGQVLDSVTIERCSKKINEQLKEWVARLIDEDYKIDIGFVDLEQPENEFIQDEVGFNKFYMAVNYEKIRNTINEENVLDEIKKAVKTFLSIGYEIVVQPVPKRDKDFYHLKRVDLRLDEINLRSQRHERVLYKILK